MEGGREGVERLKGTVGRGEGDRKRGMEGKGVDLDGHRRFEKRSKE